MLIRLYGKGRFTEENHTRKKYGMRKRSEKTWQVWNWED